MVDFTLAPSGVVIRAPQIPSAFGYAGMPGLLELTSDHTDTRSQNTAWQAGSANLFLAFHLVRPTLSRETG